MLRWALIDVDDTLYAPQTGLWTEIGHRIERYMTERLGLARDAVPALRRSYYNRYGTTLNGLLAEHRIEPAHYLAYVHDLPLEQYIQPDPPLDAMLGRLPLTKAVFTNADTAHARRVMAQLGVAHHFTTIIDIEALDYCNKPDPRAYARALSIIGAQATECVFVDDSVRNLQAAHALGLMTVLVSPARPPRPAGVDEVIGSLLELETALTSTSRLERLAPRN